MVSMQIKHFFEKIGITIIEREIKNDEKSKQKLKKSSFKTLLNYNISFYYNGIIFYYNEIGWKLCLKTYMNGNWLLDVKRTISECEKKRSVNFMKRSADILVIFIIWYQKDFQSVYWETKIHKKITMLCLTVFTYKHINSWNKWG